MLDRLLEFAEALRKAGVPVATSEHLDGMRALAHVGVEEREPFRAALATTMVKNEAHRPAFDTLFDLYFGTRLGPDTAAREEGGENPEEFFEDLLRALSAGDGGEIREMARRAVAAFGRVEDARGGSPYFTYRVFRVLNLDSMLERLMGEAAERGAPSALDERMMREEFEERLRAFRRAVEADVRRRLAERRGPEAVAKHAVRPLPEDLEFVRATSEEIAQLRRAVVPLARRLATRLAMKRRRAHRGRLDVRRTVRASLSTGGVPFETRFRRRVPHRPELFLVCDVSGSVSAFARFTLMFVHALQTQFSRVRSFVFVDTLDEVTRLFEFEDFVQAVDRINREANVVGLDGHSDYGTSLERFWETCGEALGPRSSVLVLGDARNNYRSPGSWVMKALAQKARHVWWLNPEPRAHWDTGDSIASEYAAWIDGMVEVRNVRQLEDFIARAI